MKRPGEQPTRPRLSGRVSRLQPSPTIGAGEAVRKLLARSEDVVRFDIGEPDFDTPAHIKQAGIQAIKNGFTHYTSARGIPELREALSTDQRQKGLEVKPANITFYPGSKFGLFSILSLLVDRGDEVIIQDPVWPTYASIIEYLGGRPVGMASWQDGRPSEPTAEKYTDRISRRTKAILMNSPCNPTGAIASHEHLEELYAICERKQIPLVLDRIYSALVYDGSPDKIPDCELDRGYMMIVSGFSKEFAMTGWRLGYTICSEKFTDLLVNLQDNTTTCAPAFVQQAGVAALTGDRRWQKQMNEEYLARRDTMVNEIKKIPRWECAPPAGAFYCFPRIHTLDSTSFARSLLNEKRVSSVAGDYFGRSGRGHLRLSYTTPKARIIEGMERIREFVS